MSYLNDLESRLYPDLDTFLRMMSCGAVAVIYPNNRIGYLTGVNIDSLLEYKYFAHRFGQHAIVVEICKEDRVCWVELE